MGYDGKYGTITAEHKTFDDDEPLFVLRSTDRLAPMLLTIYALLVGSHGRQEVAGKVSQQWADMVVWQQRHPERVKLPD